MAAMRAQMAADRELKALAERLAAARGDAQSSVRVGAEDLMSVLNEVAALPMAACTPAIGAPAMAISWTAYRAQGLHLLRLLATATCLLTVRARAGARGG